MSIVEYLLAGLGILLIYITYFIMSRDTQRSKKINSIATAVEELHRQLYTVETKMKQEIELLSAADTPLSKELLHHELEQGLQRIAGPVSQSLEEVERNFSAYKADFDKRLRQLEEGMRSLAMPSSVSGMDDAKIIALFKQGIDLDTIAKELHLSKPEVEFVLKINRIK